jgi:tryptophanyl-tRNA synthetase
MEKQKKGQEIEKKDENKSHHHKVIDPWGSELVEDYNKIIKDFGMEPFDVSMFPKPNRVMRRGVVLAGRDLAIIANAIKEKKKFYVLSGIMPSNDKIHLGNKVVIENIRYFQEHGAEAYVCIADLEANAVRGISLEEARKRALEFHIPAYLALGLDEKKTHFYFQSENMDVIHQAYRFSTKITLNEYRAIYGEADPSRIMGSLTQAGDILFPQLTHRMPGIVPVGFDQDPHIRLTRDIVRRMKAEKYFLPSGMYHKYTPSLDGAVKMSKSNPDAAISLPEDPKAVCKKLNKALTGGRETVEIQREKGGVPGKCMIFELYKQHLIEDDSDLQERYDLCTKGKILCGECKKLACEKMTIFLENLDKKILSNREKVNKLDFIRFK